MNILLDTNIILRLGDAGSPQHRDALGAVEALNRQGVSGVLVPQVLYEYWVVVTRPSQNNGLGMSVAAADQAVHQWMETFRLLRDERGIFGHWHGLVRDYDVKGKNGHDARLVAAMGRHGIVNLLTFNTADFLRFPGIRVFSPTDILAGQIPT